jgi:hypothetical protein
MPTHRSTSDIVSDIARTSLPAMVVDTCVSLDIVRCVWRGSPRIIGIAKQFIDAHRNGELLLLCTLRSAAGGVAKPYRG